MDNDLKEKILAFNELGKDPEALQEYVLNLAESQSNLASLSRKRVPKISKERLEKLKEEKLLEKYGIIDKEEPYTEPRPEKQRVRQTSLETIYKEKPLPTQQKPFDINQQRIEMVKSGVDKISQIAKEKIDDMSKEEFENFILTPQGRINKDKLLEILQQSWDTYLMSLDSLDKEKSRKDDSKEEDSFSIFGFLSQSILFKKFKGNIKNGLSKLKNIFVNSIKKIFSGIKSLITHPIKSFKSLFNFFKNIIIKGKNLIIKAIQTIAKGGKTVLQSITTFIRHPSKILGLLSKFKKIKNIKDVFKLKGISKALKSSVKGGSFLSAGIAVAEAGMSFYETYKKGGTDYGYDLLSKNWENTKNNFNTLISSDASVMDKIFAGLDMLVEPYRYAISIPGAVTQAAANGIASLYDMWANRGTAKDRWDRQTQRNIENIVEKAIDKGSGLPEEQLTYLAEIILNGTARGVEVPKETQVRARMIINESLPKDEKAMFVISNEVLESINKPKELNIGDLRTLPVEQSNIEINLQVSTTNPFSKDNNNIPYRNLSYANGV